MQNVHPGHDAWVNVDGTRPYLFQCKRITGFQQVHLGLHFFFHQGLMLSFYSAFSIF
jgi:hypothetical protein